MPYDETLEECTAFRSSAQAVSRQPCLGRVFWCLYVFFFNISVNICYEPACFLFLCSLMDRVSVTSCASSRGPHILSSDQLDFAAFIKQYDWVCLRIGDHRRPLNPMMYHHLPYETWIYKWLSMGVHPICRHTHLSHLSKWYVFKWKVKESQ